MKFKSPAFQFYPADWLGSQRVSLMTLEEEGAYIRLLSYCWQHGSIPADPAAAARLIGKGATTTLASNVLTMFQPPLEGCLPVGSQLGAVLVHDRLQTEKDKQLAWKTKSSEGGKKSAEKRKNQHNPENIGQPPLEGCLENGGNQKATLQSMFTVYNSNSSNEELQELANANSTPANAEVETVEEKPEVVKKTKDSDELFLSELSRHYPNIDVEQELRNMDAWIIEHPGRRKTRRFVVGWLNRCQTTLPAESAESSQSTQADAKDEYNFIW